MQKLTGEQVAAAGKVLREKKADSRQGMSPQRKTSLQHLRGAIPLALLPEEAGGQGMTPSSIPGLFKDKLGSLCNGQGMAAIMADCNVCFDTGFVKVTPQSLGRASRGAWHWVRVACPKWDKETGTCAV
jgi:hypothetical protein